MTEYPVKLALAGIILAAVTVGSYELAARPHQSVTLQLPSTTDLPVGSFGFRRWSETRSIRYEIGPSEIALPLTPLLTLDLPDLVAVSLRDDTCVGSFAFRRVDPAGHTVGYAIGDLETLRWPVMHEHDRNVCYYPSDILQTLRGWAR